MRNKRLFFLSIMLFSSLFTFSSNLKCKNNLKIGLFDTTHIEKYRYKPFTQICKSVDFDIDYKSVAQIIDSNINLDNYDGIFFIIGIEFLRGIVNKSIVAYKILNLIKQFSKKENKLIGLMLPPIGKVNTPNKLYLFSPILMHVGLQISPTTISLLKPNKRIDTKISQKTINDSLDLFAKTTKNFLNFPFEARSFLYHTTLTSPRNAQVKMSQSFHQDLITTLPIKQNVPIPLTPTLPYGICWQDPFRNNTLFLTSSSLLSFSGIAESFHICPSDFYLRKKMQKAIQETMCELKTIFTYNNPLRHPKMYNKIPYKKIITSQKPPLPSYIKNFGAPIEQANNNHLKKIGWMEINLFEPQKYNNNQKEKNLKRKKQQEFLLESILKSGENLYLWISLNPQMYHSPIAVHKDRIDFYWQTIANFTKKLQKRALTLNVKPPKILIGFEIVNNINAPHLPQQPAKDLYKNSYYDVPHPLDKNFWKNEIKIPLAIFMEKWQNPQISNGISIGGIVLDLEMYRRRTTGSLLDSMGFIPKNIKRFAMKIKDKNLQTIDQLVSKKKLQDFFKYLQSKAQSLGQNLKIFFNKQIPNGFIACYAPNISTAWFYKGLYNGLSDKNNPLQLLTFNKEFNIHKRWLEKNNIFANHSSVLMLSKLKTVNDFNIVNEILKHNNGIWFNKWSRFAEDIQPDNIEQSTLNKKDSLKFFDYVRTIN